MNCCLRHLSPIPCWCLITTGWAFSAVSKPGLPSLPCTISMCVHYLQSCSQWVMPLQRKRVPSCSFWGTVPQTSSAWEKKHAWNGKFSRKFLWCNLESQLFQAPFPSISPIILLGTIQCLLLGLMVCLSRSIMLKSNYQHSRGGGASKKQ